MLENNNTYNTQNSNVDINTEATVNNPGHSQAQEGVQPSVDNTVQTTHTPGPDAAFAQMRQENERLRRIADDEEVKQFIAQREQKKLEEEAAKQNLSVEAAQRLAALEQKTRAYEDMQMEAQVKGNFNAFAKNFGMDERVLVDFAQWMDTNYPEMANLGASNPTFDFTPFGKLFANERGATQVTAPQSAKPVFIPGHGSSTSATTQSEQDKIMAFIKEQAKD